MNDRIQQSNLIEFEQLEYSQIIGLIQLLTDINCIDDEQRNGFYIKSNDFRLEALEILEKLSQKERNKLIRFLEKQSYID